MFTEFKPPVLADDAEPASEAGGTEEYVQQVTTADGSKLHIGQWRPAEKSPRVVHEHGVQRHVTHTAVIWSSLSEFRAGGRRVPFANMQAIRLNDGRVMVECLRCPDDQRYISPRLGSTRSHLSRAHPSPKAATKQRERQEATRIKEARPEVTKRDLRAMPMDQLLDLAWQGANQDHLAGRVAELQAQVAALVRTVRNIGRLAGRAVGSADANGNPE